MAGIRQDGSSWPSSARWTDLSADCRARRRARVRSLSWPAQLPLSGRKQVARQRYQVPGATCMAGLGWTSCGCLRPLPGSWRSRTTRRAREGDKQVAVKLPGCRPIERPVQGPAEPGRMRLNLKPAALLHRATPANELANSHAMRASPTYRANQPALPTSTYLYHPLTQLAIQRLCSAYTPPTDSHVRNAQTVALRHAQHY